MTGPLLALHLSDGVVTLPWQAGGFAGATALVFLGLWRLPEDAVPRIGVLAAAFFVGSQVHVPTGIASVHLLLNGLMGAMLGRRAGLAVAVGMTMQYYLFGHGGQTTLGLNTCIVGVPAVVGGAAFSWVRRAGLSPFAAGCILGTATAAAAVVGNYCVLVFGGKEDWRLAARLVLLANLPVVVAEGAIVGYLVAYLTKVKPELLEAR